MFDFRMNVRRRPIEILGSIVPDDQWYSVIISNLDKKVEPHFILNKVYQEAEDGTYEETNTVGVYKSRHATEQDFEIGIYKHPTHNLSTTLAVYNEMSLVSEGGGGFH